MNYDKTLKTQKDKDLWDFLQGGVFSDNRDRCIELRKQGFTKKEIVDSYSPIYNKMNKLFEKLNLNI